MKVKLGCAALALIATLAFQAKSGQKVEDPATKKKVQAAVEKYVKDETSLKGGFFLRDGQENMVRDLKFDHVHQGVEQAEAGQYAVCVDFLDQSKKRLDVDFWLKSAATGELEVSKIRIHKVNGVERKAEPSPGETKKQ